MLHSSHFQEIANPSKLPAHTTEPGFSLLSYTAIFPYTLNKLNLTQAVRDLKLVWLNYFDFKFARFRRHVRQK